MSYADHLSDKERRHYRHIAITSTMFGCISTQLIESNALIVLYLTMLGGGSSISMFSAGLPSLSHILLLIPCASFAARFGLRRTYTVSSIVGFLTFLAIAAAPYTGSFARYTVIGACFIYALSLTIYTSTWYPLLDNILQAGDRSAFFGRMRFIYMLFNAGLLFLLGKLLGADPGLSLLQWVFVIAGFGLIGRKFCMDALPIDPEMKRESPDLKKALSTCLHNQPLVGFSVYLCFMYMAFSAAMPLALVYMKTELSLAAGTIMIITSLNLIGKVTGFWLLARLTKKFSMRFLIVAVHLFTFLAVTFLLLLLPDLPFLSWFFGAAFFMLGVIHALLLNINSIEMLALAKPGNKIMAIAFCSTAIAVGTAAGTTITSLLLGCGALAPRWQFMGLELTKFQLLFAVYALAIFFFLILLPLVPAVIRHHDDYYNP